MMPVFGGEGMAGSAIPGGGDSLVTVETLPLIKVACRVMIFSDVGAMAFGAVARCHGGGRGAGSRSAGGSAAAASPAPASPGENQFRCADQNQQTQKKPYSGYSSPLGRQLPFRHNFPPVFILVSRV